MSTRHLRGRSSRLGAVAHARRRERTVLETALGRSLVLAWSLLVAVPSGEATDM